MRAVKRFGLLHLPRLKGQKSHLHSQRLTFQDPSPNATAHQVTAVGGPRCDPPAPSHDLHAISSDLGHSNLTAAALQISMSGIYSPARVSVDGPSSYLACLHCDDYLLLMSPASANPKFVGEDIKSTVTDILQQYNDD